MSSYRGEIILCGKRHVVEVIDGVRNSWSKIWGFLIKLLYL